MRRKYEVTGALLAVCLMAGSGCSDDAMTAVEDNSAVRMEVVSGNAQYAVPGTQLPDPLVVRVVDANGNPVSGQIVNFRVTSGGGSVYAGAGLTNAQGQAREWWTLGPTEGPNKLEARAVDSDTGERLVFATFEATAAMQAPVATVAVSPPTASLQVGQTAQLQAAAKDANGQALTGRTISWSSSNAAVASVSSSGLVTAAGAGSATITATSEGKSGTSAVTVTTAPSSGGSIAVNECAQQQSAWIWCDDFEQNRLGSYFEYDSRNGGFSRVSGVGNAGSSGMRATFSAGQTSAGSLKLAFGRTPDSYMRPVDAGTANYREIYWRFYVRNAPNWTGGGGDKLTRAVVFAASNWAEAAIGHIWSGGSTSNRNHLLLEPASGTDTQGNLRTTQYNDFANLRWIGSSQSNTPIFDASHVGSWYCVEGHMRLNDAGQSNGVFELWIDGALEGRTANLNWVGSYAAYGINAVFLENYWNNGAPKQQERFFDNYVVSTQRIGCGGTSGSGGGGGGGGAPTVATVTVSPSSATVASGQTRQFTASALDANGGTITGKTFAWSSSNSSVASVGNTGLATASGTGSATITATVDGKSGSTTLTVTQPSTASVTVSPASASMAVGATQQLSATAKDANGNALAGKSFAWSSSNASVATVSSSGVVTARAAGSASIQATSDGQSASAAITVASGSGGGGGGGGSSSSQPSFVEDFSTYSSTAHMLSDPRGIYSESFDYYDNSSIGGANKKGAGTIELDRTDGYGGLGQSMKYTWFSYGSAGPGGQLRRMLEWPTAQTEMWSEVAFKFSPNFKTDYGYSGGASYKWLFFVGPNMGHGWHLELVGSGGVVLQGYEDMSGGKTEKPAPYSNNFDLSDLADGQWHVLRVHIRRNSPYFDVMIDGTRNRAPLTNWSSSATIWGLILGQNINMRPVNNVQTLKYGYVKVWYGNNNPGWGW